MSMEEFSLDNTSSTQEATLGEERCHRRTNSFGGESLNKLVDTMSLYSQKPACELCMNTNTGKVILWGNGRIRRFDLVGASRGAVGVSFPLPTGYLHGRVEYSVAKDDITSSVLNPDVLNSSVVIQDTASRKVSRIGYRPGKVVWVFIVY